MHFYRSTKDALTASNQQHLKFSCDDRTLVYKQGKNRKYQLVHNTMKRYIQGIKS